MKKLLIFLLLVPFACKAQTPTQITQPYNFTKYVLIKNDTVWSMSKILDWIPVLSKVNWDTAFNRSHRHNNFSVLQGIKPQDTARWGSGGTTITDGLLHWNGTKYIPYSSITDTSLIFARRAITSPSSYNSLGILTLNGQMVIGSSNVLNNRVAILGQSYSNTGLQGISYSGPGSWGSSTNGWGLYGTSVNGVGAIFSIGSGNTSDITQFQYNGSNKSYIDKDGIYGLSGIYKMPSSAGSSGQFLQSSGSGNQLTWGSVNTNTSNLLYWNSTIGAYTPYTSYSDTSLIFVRSSIGTPISTINHFNYLGLNASFAAGSSNSSYNRVAITGHSYGSTGVYGESTSFYGVNAQSNTGIALHAISSTNNALYAVSGGAPAAIFNISSGLVQDIFQGQKSSIVKFRVDSGGNAYKSLDTFALRSWVRTLASVGFANPMTTSGDIIYGGTSGAATRKGIGSTGQVLTVSGGLPIWANPWSPVNNLLNWNSTIGAYTPYTSISDTSLIFARGSTPSTQNALGYLNLNGQLVVGSSHASNNRNAIRGISYSGNGIVGNSVTGVSAIFNNSAGNTSDIGQFQKNGINKFRVDSGGNAYKAATDTFALKSDIRNYALSKADYVVSDSILYNAHLTGISTAPTAAIGTNTTQIANTAFVLANSGLNLANEINKAGGNVKSITLGLTNPGAGTYTMVDGTVYFALMYLDSAMTIHGIRIGEQAAGSFTADNYNGIGLYSISGSTATLVASSTNDGTLWTMSYYYIEKALSANYTVPTKGLYAVGLLYNSSAETTAPVLYAGSSHGSGGFTALGLSYGFYSTLATQNTLPSPVTMTSNANAYIPVIISFY